MKRYLKTLVLLLGLSGGWLPGWAQPLPPNLLIDERFRQPVSRSYWTGRTANLEVEMTPAGYALRSLVTTDATSYSPIRPVGPPLNQTRDFVIEGELRGQGQVALYWGGQARAGDYEYTLVQLSLATASPTVEVLRRQAGAWTLLGTAPLPAAVPPADWHRVRIARTGSTVAYWVDGSRVLEQPWTASSGPDLGVVVNGPGAALTLRRLRLWHHHDLRLVPGVPATLRRERLPAPGLNTPAEESSPQVSADGRYLYFSRALGISDSLNNPQAYDADVFVTERDARGAWGPARSVGPPINLPAASNYPLYAAPDGQTLLVSGYYNAAGQLAGRGLSRTQRQADGTWTPPAPLPAGTGNLPDFVSRDAISCLDASGTVLLVSAVRQGNLANTELYLCRRQPDGTWTAPQLLPAPLNTPGRETTPFLAPDNRTLYFASDTHPGYGNSDIFMSRRLDESWTKWSEPLNLGPAVNTALDELFYCTSAVGDYAYLVGYADDANRADIYRLALPPALRPAPVLLVRGRVLDARTRQPIATAEVRYEQLPTGTESGVVLPATAGSFEAVLPAGQLYGLRATAPGYLSVNENLDLTMATKYAVVTQDLLLVPLAAGGDAPGVAASAEKKIALNNVFFVQGKPVLLPGSFPELKRLAQTLADNPTLRIRLDGHTDNLGAAPANQLLSEQRVAAIKAYLVKRGVAGTRIETHGYGGSRPVAPNDSEVNKRKNRRVEFVVVSR